MTTLLRDVFSFGTLQILNEGKSQGPLRVRGLFQEAEKKNGNGRVYDKKLLSREVDKLQEVIKQRRLVGELDHPSDEIVHLANASHVITGLHMDGNQVIGEAELLNTPSGKVLQELVKAGVMIGTSSRATGSLDHDVQENCYRVCDNLRMITWDMVSDPSCEGAHPTLQEGLVSEARNPIVEELDHLKAERVYITALRKHLNKK